MTIQARALAERCKATRWPAIAAVQPAIGVDHLRQCRVVWAVKSAPTWAATKMEVPISMVLSTSTTCCCLPSASLGTVEASLKSTCHCLMGAGRSHGSWWCGRRPQMRPGGSQDPIDGPRGARQSLARAHQVGITRQLVQQRLGSWGPSQAFWRLITHLQEAVDHHLADARRRMFACTRLAVQDGFILRQRFSQALDPFLDPAY